MPAFTGGSRPGASVPRSPSAATLLLIAGLAVISACGSGPALEHTVPSPKAVAEAVVQALDRKDVAALERLAISEDEFRELVWPRLPAARPERNIPWDYAWKDLAAKSRIQIRGRVRAWQPAAVTVVGVSFDGETTDYGTYRVQRESLVTLRDAEGRVTTARLFGSIIEQRGHFKVFSYVVD